MPIASAGAVHLGCTAAPWSAEAGDELAINAATREQVKTRDDYGLSSVLGR